MPEPEITPVYRPPVAEARAALTRMMTLGCAAHDMPPPFGPLPCFDEATFRRAEPPFFLVSLEGKAEMLTEGAPGRWIVPLKMELFHPLSAPAPWVEAVIKRWYAVLLEAWHEAEVANVWEQTPLGIRLTTVAAEAEPVIPFSCAFANAGEIEGPDEQDDLAVWSAAIEVCGSALAPAE